MVIAFKLDEYSKCDGDMDIERDPRVNYFMSLDNPSLPPLIEGDLLWFQHSFGMWGRVNTQFIKLIEQGKRSLNKVAASFHRIHFQSGRNPVGYARKRV